jgi:hypothetical protein
MREIVIGLVLTSWLSGGCADDDAMPPAADAAQLPTMDASSDAAIGVSTPKELPMAAPAAAVDAALPITDAGPSIMHDTPDAAPCSDVCPKVQGIDWLCRLRFMYGVNYAWHHFGADFGGNARWMQPGVSDNPKVDMQLAEMAAHGVSVVRWWVFPDFRGDGVAFDAADKPTGLGGSAHRDVARALELAEKHNLYLMLTLFSFDNFRPTSNMSGGVRARSIKPLIVDATERANLMEKVVRPFARAVAESPHRDRLIAWDVINEPEWAISGPSMYGDPMFDLNPDLEGVSHAQMETFLRDALAVLRAESRALLSIGSAAIKWRHAWEKLDVDFDQFHMYEWVDMYWPYDRSPRDYGLQTRPVVMGEFPAGGLTRAPYGTLLQSWYGNGYAGALAWAYTDGLNDLSDVKRFADQHACEVAF